MAKGTRKEIDTRTNVLRTIPLFSTCTKKELNVLADSLKEVPFKEGDEICREGETGVGLHVILEGEVKVTVGGRTKRRMGPGSFFGEVAVLDGGPRTATVLAVTPVKTLAMPVWEFRAIIGSDAHMAMKMLEEMCRRIRSAYSSLTD